MNTVESTAYTHQNQPTFGIRLLLAALLLGLSGLAQAAPLNLVLNPEPDILSSFITVDYNSGADLLTATGFADNLISGGTTNPITGGTFDLSASISGALRCEPYRRRRETSGDAKQESRNSASVRIRPSACST